MKDIKLKIKKTIAMLFVFSLVYTSFTVPVNAVETTERTSTLDLTTAEFQTDQENTIEGWKWDASTSTLTLTNVNFNTGDQACLKIPTTKDVKMMLVGENSLIANKVVINRDDRPVEDAKLSVSGDKLSIKSNTNDASIDVNNFILESGDITIQGGSLLALETIQIHGGSITMDTTDAHTWNYAFYATGAIYITGGNVNLKSGEVSLFVDPIQKNNLPHAIEITGGTISISGSVAAAYVYKEDVIRDIYINTQETINITNDTIGFYNGNGNIVVELGNFDAINMSKLFAVDSAYGDVQLSDADYTKVDETIANAEALDKTLYINFSDVDNAINAVIRDKNITEQTLVDGYAKAIEDAISALVYKDANYTKVDEAIAKVGTLDKTLYIDFSDVDNAIYAVIRDKNITEQTLVDNYAKAIEDAISALVYKDANYTKVDEAIANAEVLDKTLYIDFSDVDTAINAVIRDKDITEQTLVDGYAKAIEDAISALVYKNADYTKVEEAIAKVGTIDKTLYINFSDVDNAINAVIRDKNIAEQTLVDGYAKAIEDAISALVYKDADYTKVEEAISKVGTLDKTLYIDFSDVDNAINAVIRDKNITEQTLVDNYAKAIEKAISELIKKEEATKPDTGDTANIDLYITLSLLSISVITLFSKKRKYAK